MQFSNTEEEEDFSLGSAGRSRLSSLFQGEGSGGDINQALTYTAPKQPKRNDGNQSSSEQLKVIHVAVVYAYKLENGKYANQGKLGCAILGNHDTSDYKLLLYKGKQVQVTCCTIAASFVFHVQPNNYANFYDDRKENWSLMFESEEALIELVKQIALAKFNSHGKNATSLLVQDLVPGEGPALEIGDSAEIKYSGWLLTSCAFGQLFDSNFKSESSFRLRLGKSKVIKGWTEGLRGAQKGSKRLLIISPSLAYGAEGMGNSVPPNSTLIFEVHVKKVKISRDSSHSPSPIKIISDVVAEKKPEVPPRTHSVSEDTVRMRGASISEQLSQSPKKDKAQLISRMAKMGTATLPLHGAVPAQPSSESENEEDTHHEVRNSSPVSVEVTRSRESSPKLCPRSRQNSNITPVTQTIHPHLIQESPNSIPIHVSPHSSQLSLYAQAATPSPQSYMSNVVPFPAYPAAIGAQFPVPQQQYPMHSSIADTHLPLLITESRSQNTEVRLGLSKITDKVDVIIQKMDDFRFQQGNVSSSGQLPTMEGAILAQNIERIVQENAQLKKEAETKNSKIQSLNEKICDLLQRNQRFFEESNCMLEQRSDTLQASAAQSHSRLLSLEQEKIKLTSDLSDSVSKLSRLEAELIKHQTLETELQQKLQSSENIIKKQESLLNEVKGDQDENHTLVSSLRDELKSVKHERQLLSTKLQSLEGKLSVLEEANDFLEKNLRENRQRLSEAKANADSRVEKLTSMHESEIELWKLKLKQITETPTEHSSGEDEETGKLKLEIENLHKEKDIVESKMEELEKKLSLSEKSESSSREKLLELQSDVENALIWKKKYEVFYEKTRALKEKYESQITELIDEVKQLQRESSKLPSHSKDFTVEIKKVMNVLYKMLAAKFDRSASYDGSQVLEIALQTIKALTFQMLELKSQEPKTATDVTSSSEKINSQPDVSIKASELSTNTSKERRSDSDVNSDQPKMLLEAKESDIKQIKSEVSSTTETVPQEPIENLEKSNSDIQTNKTDEPSCNGTEITSSVPAENVTALQPQPDNNRISPDVWKPQPPPLFDDDDDEDSDEWLK